MSDESSLNITEQDGISVIGFANAAALNAYSIADTAKELYALIDKFGLRLLLLDLSTVQMLSSQSLGVFLTMKEKLKPIDGKLAISGIDPKLYRVFKITKLQEVFEFFDNVETAVNQMKID